MNAITRLINFITGYQPDTDNNSKIDAARLERCFEENRIIDRQIEIAQLRLKLNDATSKGLMSWAEYKIADRELGIESELLKAQKDLCREEP